jgi:hypothetical protein
MAMATQKAMSALSSSTRMASGISAAILTILRMTGAKAEAKKAPQRVQDAGIGRHQRHAGQIGKHDAREIDRQREFLGIVKPRHENPHDGFHEDFGEDGDDQNGRDQPAHDAAGEQLRRLFALGFERRRKHGYEGGVESAFGKEPPEQIGEAEGGVESVGGRAYAQHRGHQRVAGKAGNARDQGQPADREKIAVEAHGNEAPSSPLPSGERSALRAG